MAEQRFDRRSVDVKATEKIAELANSLRGLGVSLDLRRVRGQRERVGERQAAGLADELREKLCETRNQKHAPECYRGAERTTA